jgi:CelD/BcsL family acetyltransferase involved in cellulose biosynthesis
MLRVARPLSCGSGEEYGEPLLHGLAGTAIVAEVLHAAMQVRADILEIRFAKSDSVRHKAIEPLPQSCLLPFVPKRLREFPRWEDFAATLSKSLRAELRCHLRRLSAMWRTELGWCKTVDDAEATLTWLFANKRRRALSRGWHTKYLMDDQVRDFFFALARRTDLMTTPLVTLVKLDGMPVAASVNLVGRHSFEGFIMTYEEAFGACSPGSLLQEFCVRWSHANERNFDFRPFNAPYKVRRANRETFHSTQTVFLSARGRLAEFALLAGYGSRLVHKFRKIMVDVASRQQRMSDGRTAVQHQDRRVSR